MLEKFTQKAIDIVQNARIQAGNFGSDKVYSEHILLALAPYPAHKDWKEA